MCNSFTSIMHIVYAYNLMSMEEFPPSTEQQMTYSLQIFFHAICLKRNYMYVLCWTQHNCGFVGQDWMQDNSYAKEMELTIYYLFWTHLCTQGNHNSGNVLLKTLSWFSFFKVFFSMDFFISNEHWKFSHISCLWMTCHLSVKLCCFPPKQWKFSALDPQLEGVFLRNDSALILKGFNIKMHA